MSATTPIGPAPNIDVVGCNTNTRENGGSLQTRNNNRNNNTFQPRFKIKIEEVAVLGTRLECGNKSDWYIMFR